MFPSFKSLQDKRNKRQQLLQQIEREQELERIKNEAYALTDWASDQAKMMALNQIPSTTTASTQTTTNTISGSTQTDNNTSTGSTQTDASPMQSATTQTNTPTSTLVSTAAQTDESGDVKQPVVEPRVKVEPGIHDEQAAAKDEIEYIYGKLPQLTGKKISPLKSNGMPDKDTFIGAEGKIHNRRTGKPSRKADFSFDFSQTLRYLRNFQDQLDIRDEPMPEQSNRDTSTNLADGAIEAGAKDLLKQILQTNDLFRFKGVPIGKLKHPKSHQYWEYPNYHIGKDLNIVSDSFGKKNYNSITSKISCGHTLSNFVSILKQNNVSFKQSNLFTGVKNKWDSPLSLSDLSASLNNANNKASQHNGATYLKDRVIQLYNDNDWLVDYNIHPVALPRGDSKAFREANYVLGEYAKIYRIGKNVNIKDVSQKSLTALDKKVDWAATYDMIMKDYYNDVFGKNQMYEPETSMIANRLNNINLSGTGLRIHGRRGILNNERYTLSGELLLGNKNSKIRKELGLLHQYERK